MDVSSRVPLSYCFSPLIYMRTRVWDYIYMYTCYTRGELSVFFFLSILEFSMGDVVKYFNAIRELRKVELAECKQRPHIY